MTTPPLRLVIAEDDCFVSELVVEAAESAGFVVAGCAADGRRAVDLVRLERPDAVIMDIQMPELDGISAAEEIQRTCPTPVVVLTAHAEKEVLERAVLAGVGAYLIKPARPEELLRSVSVARARFGDLREQRRISQELRAALEAVKTLKGLLPICTTCKRIRDGDGYWRRVESYVQAHSNAEFSHGICPSCLERDQPEVFREMKDECPEVLGKIPTE